MELVNALYLTRDELGADEKGRRVLGSAVSSVLAMLAPITPHLCEELWEQLGHKDMLTARPWPRYDEDALLRDEVVIPVSVNGKLRSKMTVPAGTGKEELEKLALAEANVVRHTEGLTVRKVIVIPGKMVNVVAS
jgi:leucyl-tRNA synthetase